MLSDHAPTFKNFWWDVDQKFLIGNRPSVIILKGHINEGPAFSEN